MNSEDLAGAARWIDGTTEESLTTATVYAALNAPASDVKYVADQRALRILMILKKYKMPIYKQAIKVTGDEDALIQLMSVVSLDGICIGLAASQGRSEPMPSKESLN